MPKTIWRVVVTLTSYIVTLTEGVVVSMSLGPGALKRRPLRSEESAPGIEVVVGDLVEFGYEPYIVAL